MTAPEDQNGLREALARYLHDEVNGVGGWPSLTDKARDGWRFSAERLIAGPLASLIAERDAAVSKAALDENAAAAWKRKTQEAECTINDLAGIDQRAAEYCRERDDAVSRALAAEAEITRLKEGMEAAVEKNTAQAIQIDNFDKERRFAARVLEATKQEYREKLLGARIELRNALATLSPKEHPHG